MQSFGVKSTRFTSDQHGNLIITRFPARKVTVFGHKDAWQQDQQTRKESEVGISRQIGELFFLINFQFVHIFR